MLVASLEISYPLTEFVIGPNILTHTIFLFKLCTVDCYSVQIYFPSQLTLSFCACACSLNYVLFPGKFARHRGMFSYHHVYFHQRRNYLNVCVCFKFALLLVNKAVQQHYPSTHNKDELLLYKARKGNNIVIG